MVEIYDSEKEQIESIKTWWKENGRAITIGLVLGIGGVVGWTSWNTYSIGRAEQASMLYEQVVNWAAADNYAQTVAAAEQLMSEYANSGYAALAALISAADAYAAKEVSKAKGHLQWVMDNSVRPELSHVARLRLARIHLQEGNNDQALALLDTSPPPSFAINWQETRGDIHLANNDAEAARQSYNTALDSTEPSASAYRRIKMKLDDLGELSEPDNIPSVDQDQ